MDKELTEDELDIAVVRFLNTYKDFEKAAKKLMSIMESMNKQKYQELKALSGNSKQIHEFLIQAMDDSGHIKEHPFSISYVSEKEKRKE